ncbi:17275_t:CDS:2 [Funneliformis caledonium]|uniref:17275_t:CDS:1 n=1 Tax=Funneliformis caledonium TaxID=1117310 RepID=A0A9N9G9B6_9GLOM|nr:17275_t:CDS:2 [Funneliformis caledonium]
MLVAATGVSQNSWDLDFRGSLAKGGSPLHITIAVTKGVGSGSSLLSFNIKLLFEGLYHTRS